MSDVLIHDLLRNHVLEAGMSKATGSEYEGMLIDYIKACEALLNRVPIVRACAEALEARRDL